MTNSCDFDCTAKTLKAIAQPLRLKILCTLNTQELTVAEIVRRTSATQSNISQHLIMLRELGILDARRDANRVYYRVDNPGLLEIIRMMREVYCGNEAA